MSPSSSNASSISAYFSSILQEKYDIPGSEAEKAVSAWRYGKDKEVLDYDRETYRAICGDEIGAILFGWKADYSKSVLRKRMYGRSLVGIERETAIVLGIMSGFFFLVAWIIRDLIVPIVALAVSGVLFAGAMVIAVVRLKAEEKVGESTDGEKHGESEKGIEKHRGDAMTQVLRRLFELRKIEQV